MASNGKINLIPFFKKSNRLIWIAIILAIIFFGYSYLQKDKQPILEQKSNEESTEVTSTNEIIEELKKEIKELKQQTQKESTDVAPQPEEAENLDLVLLKYKTENDSIEELSNILLNAVVTNTLPACQTIVQSRTTRQHSYFMFLDALTILQSGYNKYKNQIEWINNNLRSYEDIQQIIKDYCSSVGLEI